LLDFWRRVRPQTVFSLEGGDGEPSLGQDAEEALFRVAQEGVSNAVRHGAPAHVTVSVARGPGTLSLSVADDGGGGACRPGHGLTFMKARVTSAGGSLAIVPGQGGRHGWTVTATVPACTGAPA
jgi:signal transduction histidine kinase